ncbi:MAG: hypothetical protein ACUZ8E_02680 [Candidatus Anammoxibacter sp.]
MVNWLQGAVVREQDEIGDLVLNRNLTRNHNLAFDCVQTYGDYDYE